MGYWIIVGMIVCSFGMIVIALSVDSRPVQDRSPLGDQPEASPSSRLGPSTVGTFDIEYTWTAFVVAGTATAWPERSGAPPPGWDLSVNALSDPSARGLRAALDNHLKTESPRLITTQVGLIDILSGVELQTFSSDLASVLEELYDRNISAIVGTIPDLSELSIPALAAVDAKALLLLTQRWNAEIVSLLNRFDVKAVDLLDVRRSTTSGPGADLSGFAIATTLDQEAIAARFAPIVAAAMRDVQESGQFRP